MTPSGPLVPLLGGGGVSLDAPRHNDHWTGNFGSLNLCSSTGEPVEISSVDYHYRVEPVATRAVIRQTPPASERDGKPSKWAPLGSFQGTFAHLRHEQIRFASLERGEGATFATPCEKGDDAAYTELITSISVDPRGAWIDGITINYTSGDQTYALSVDYTYAACGTAVQEEFFCDPNP